MRLSSDSLRRLAILAGSALASGAGAAAPVLQNVLVSKEDGIATIEIRFACPNRYMSHASLAAGLLVEVSLVQMGPCDTRVEGSSEATRPAGRALAALAEIEYGLRSGTDAQLRLHFERTVVVTVEPSADPRSLRFAVRIATDPVPVTPPAIAATVPAVSAPTATGLTVEQQARAEARARAALAPRPAAPPSAALCVVNLRSTTAAIDVARERAGMALAGETLYVTDVRVEEQVWHRLRLGFFATEAEAAGALARLRVRYPDAWVTRVSPAERAAAGAVVTGEALPAATIATGATPEGTVPELLAATRAAILAANYPDAVRLATNALDGATGAEAAEARELLGLARERSGQTAHAVAEYRRYLEEQPDGEGAERVRQRLAALTTARRQPQESLRGRTASGDGADWQAWGGVAQYYRQDSMDYGGRSIDQAMLLSDAELVARRSGERFDVGARATLGYDVDLSDGDDGPGNQTRIYNLYMDVADEDLGLSTRLGRQTLRNQGVLGRFDGALLSWQWSPQWRVNALGGFPVYGSDEGVDTARVFYGMSLDRLGLFDLFDANVFVNVQEIDGVSDREAVGGELRWFGADGTVVTALDYDVGYGELNSLAALGNWTFASRVTVNAMFDWRKTPFLTTENALIGQSAGSIDELLQSFTEDQIRELAADRTGSMQTTALGVATPLSERFQVSADVTVSQFEGTPASGGVPGTPDSGAETYYYVSLIGSSLLAEGDVSILGLRYSDGMSAATAAVFLDTRYPIGQRLRVNPRLLVSQRDYATGGVSELSVRPALRLFYRLGRNYHLEFDGGGEFGSRDEPAGSTDVTAWYVYVGYRADF